jgi:hypothetical protein
LTCGRSASSMLAKISLKARMSVEMSLRAVTILSSCPNQYGRTAFLAGGRGCPSFRTCCADGDRPRAGVVSVNSC